MVMELPAGDDGLPAMAVLFDLDDEGQFAVTHLAHGATTQPFSMATQLFWQGAWRATLQTQEGTDDDGAYRPVEGWRRNILGEAARLDDPATGRSVTILSSRPRSASSGTKAPSPCSAARAAPPRSTTRPPIARRPSTASDTSQSQRIRSRTYYYRCGISVYSRHRSAMRKQTARRHAVVGASVPQRCRTDGAILTIRHDSPEKQSECRNSDDRNHHFMAYSPVSLPNRAEWLTAQVTIRKFTPPI